MGLSALLLNLMFYQVGLLEAPKSSSQNGVKLSKWFFVCFNVLKLPCVNEREAIWVSIFPLQLARMTGSMLSSGCRWEVPMSVENEVCGRITKPTCLCYLCIWLHITVHS